MSECQEKLLEIVVCNMLQLQALMEEMKELRKESAESKKALLEEISALKKNSATTKELQSVMISLRANQEVLQREIIANGRFGNLGKYTNMIINKC